MNIGSSSQEICNQLQSPQRDQTIKLLLHLLEKAEQILSIINLSDSSTQKYNKLKEIIFNKCNLPFRPLVKKTSISTTSVSNSSRSSIVSDLSTISNHQSTYSSYDSLKQLTIKKNLMIELLFDIIDNMRMSNVKICRNQMMKESKDFQIKLDSIYTYSQSSTFVDNDFDYKIDELKFNDYLSKCDLNVKTISLNLSKSGSLFQSENSFDDIINSYNKKIEDLKKYQQKEILQYEEKFNELKVKYNPNLDKENIKLKSLLSSISELISPVYEKFSKKKLSSFDNKLNENIGEDKEIIQINFLICFIEQLFTDNKHLIETIQSMEIEKNDILNIPYITNTIKKNDILKNIQDIISHIFKKSKPVCAVFSKEIMFALFFKEILANFQIIMFDF